MPQGRSMTMLSRSPVARLLSAQGRCGYTRRASQRLGDYNEMNLLASVAQFGGPPQWEPINLLAANVEAMSGELWVPSGILASNYTDVRAFYVAGYHRKNIPQVIKQACANIINVMIKIGGDMGGGIKRFSSGDTSIEKFADTIIDAETRSLLNPFQAKAFG